MTFKAKESQQRASCYVSNAFAPFVLQHRVYGQAMSLGSRASLETRSRAPLSSDGSVGVARDDHGGRISGDMDAEKTAHRAPYTHVSLLSLIVLSCPKS